jgi:hypothetical protein
MATLYLRVSPIILNESTGDGINMRAQAKEPTLVGQTVARRKGARAAQPRLRGCWRGNLQFWVKSGPAGIGLDFVFPYWQNISVERYEKYIDFVAIVL